MDFCFGCGCPTPVMLSLPKHPAVRRIFAFYFRYARSFDYAQDDKEKIKTTPLCIDNITREILNFTA